ncbi:hypothetical protein NQZ68_004130 [Dissostichus eleginoides]|nr:hypothetical protein NQZ68_004130 [Dissostichus eleginoides]
MVLKRDIIREEPRPVWSNEIISPERALGQIDQFEDCVNKTEGVKKANGEEYKADCSNIADSQADSCKNISGGLFAFSFKLCLTVLNLQDSFIWRLLPATLLRTHSDADAWWDSL